MMSTDKMEDKLLKEVLMNLTSFLLHSLGLII